MPLANSKSFGISQQNGVHVADLCQCDGWMWSYLGERLKGTPETVKGLRVAENEFKPAEKEGFVLKTSGTALVSVDREESEPGRTFLRKRQLLIWGAAALTAVLLAGWAYSQFWMVRALPVAVEIAELAPVTRVLAVSGRIAAIHTVDVRPVVGGTLETLSVDEGDNVAVDQILGIINADTQNAVVRQSTAGLDAALVTLRQAEEAYDRMVSLGNNVARTELEASEHAVQSASQDVARQTALVDQARIALENHTIRAPISGNVLVLNVDVGQTVSTATDLLTLADLTELVVETDVDETYARQIAEGQTAILQLAGETETRAGHVSFVSTQVDVATGGLAVRIAFDEPLTAPVGLTVTTNIVVEQLAAALTLPRSAIVSTEAGPGFYTVEEGKARFTPVTVLEWPAARLIVKTGLSEGDVVVIDATGLEDDAPVKVTTP